MKPVIEKDAVDKDIASKTVCLRMSFGRFGNTRTVSSKKISVDADKDLIKVNKVLVDSDSLKAIMYADNDLKRQIEELCLPFPDQAINLVPFALVDEVNELCEKYQTETRPQLIEIFMNEWPELCKSARTKLRGVWNPKDYPTEQEVLEQFTFRYRFFYFGLPEHLKKLNIEVFKREKEKAQEVMKEAVELSTTSLLTKYVELIGNLRKSLEPGQDGKQKRIYQSSLDNFNEFFRTFDFRNVGDSEELKEQVERAKKLLNGVSVEGLRTTDTLREKVSNEFDKISQNLEPLIEVRGRKFRA